MTEQVQELLSCDEFPRRAVELIATAAAEAVAARGRFTMVLTGGRTVQPLFRHLAAGSGRELRWLLRERTDYFWGDDRMVAPEHPDSNFGLARRLFLDELMVQPEHLHPVATGLADPGVAARTYEEEMRGFFGGELTPEGLPNFDLVLLALGPDGHVASLFPAGNALAERQRWATSVSPPELAPRVARVTMTLPVLNQARLVLLMAAGGERSKLALRISAGEPGTGGLPAARLHPAGR
ncbi:MAG TPA: 6-phosphogluconolactonase, partial [Desulfurivibrionaceae bacterium]|nr:6-phosphogluconolactonase [Desulfurivibrionaceae bacterium]